MAQKNTPGPTINMKQKNKPTRNQLDQILTRVCDMLVKAQLVGGDAGAVAACILDTDGNQVFGVNVPSESGNRIHAESCAIQRYRDQFGDIPPETICITSLSPCSQPMRDREGISCEQMLQTAGIHNIYCGYQDPTQNSGYAVTSNKKIQKLCKGFADTFLKTANSINESTTRAAIEQFIPWIAKKLELDSLPKIQLLDQPQTTSFGVYDRENHQLNVVIGGRHTVDVLRTLAHELTHHKQNLQGKLNDQSGATGSEEENEANSQAGIVMRDFAKAHPEVLGLDKSLQEDGLDRSIKYQSHLNPAVWTGGELRPEVRSRLLEIALIFIKYLDIPNFRVEDVVLTGSLANFNYTQYSDFDLHVITRYSDLQCDDLAAALYRAKKQIWNDRHNIVIRGHDVELYVEDTEQSPVAAGAFSLLQNSWIKTPDNDPPDIDRGSVKAKVGDLTTQIDAVTSEGDVDDMQRLVDKLGHMRRNGLDTGGEFSVENLAFKVLRNTGYLKHLQQAILHRQDQELSLREADSIIKLDNTNSAKEWIAKVYDLYPQQFQNNHVMPLGGSGEDQQFAMFELTPSLSRRGAVEVKWIQAYPLRQGVGSRAMKELQRLAQEDGIGLTLYPWDKGQVSQSKLIKFYKGQGFAPAVKGAKHMAWSPVTESLDQPYPMTWEHGEYGDHDALAKLADGTVLGIMFNDTGDSEYQIEFLRDHSHELTGAGDAQRVMATVLSAIQQFLKFEQPNIMVFSASKEVDPGQNSQSRAKLYSRMVQRYAGAWGYNLHEKDRGDQVTYQLSRAEQGVAENFADGRNPGDKGSLKARVKGKVTVAKASKLMHKKGATPREKQLAHWFMNMRKGHKK